MTPLEPFPVITPLGPATCTGVESGDDPEWICWIESTQECWWFGNRYIRRRLNVSNGRTGISPFSHLNEPIRRQIARYIANGWLPADYDPERVETWKL